MPVCHAEHFPSLDAALIRGVTPTFAGLAVDFTGLAREPTLGHRQAGQYLEGPFEIVGRYAGPGQTGNRHSRATSS